MHIYFFVWSLLSQIDKDEIKSSASDRDKFWLLLPAGVVSTFNGNVNIFHCAQMTNPHNKWVGLPLQAFSGVCNCVECGRSISRPKVSPFDVFSLHWSLMFCLKDERFPVKS